MKKLSLALTLTLLSSLALAQTSPQGYLVDQENKIVKSGTGLCWHTGYWTPANAVEGCDPVYKRGPISHKVTLNADMLFAFNKSDLTDEGRRVLNGVVAHSTDMTLEVVAVTGYTDRIGSDAYNLKLSERRAATVRDYLITQGIAADRITTAGRGKSKSVTGDRCVGNKVTKELINCLQPDRRAVIEIIGEK